MSKTIKEEIQERIDQAIQNLKVAQTLLERSGTPSNTELVAYARGALTTLEDLMEKLNEGETQ